MNAALSVDVGVLLRVHRQAVGVERSVKHQPRRSWDNLGVRTGERVVMAWLPPG